MQQKVGSLKKFLKINKHLANLTRRRIFRDAKQTITSNTYKIQRIIREYFKNLYSNIG
jgi:hypothetical protein